MQQPVRAWLLGHCWARIYPRLYPPWQRIPLHANGRHEGLVCKCPLPSRLPGEGSFIYPRGDLHLHSMHCAGMILIEVGLAIENLYSRLGRSQISWGERCRLCDAANCGWSTDDLGTASAKVSACGIKFIPDEYKRLRPSIYCKSFPSTDQLNL